MHIYTLLYSRDLKINIINNNVCITLVAILTHIRVTMVIPATVNN
jgi:hypothetical protein